jgi:hypothetical protein
MWTADDLRRQAVFARQQGNALLVSNRRGHTITLTLSADQDADLAVDELADAAARGIKLRTRALATTLFARLLASDLFLHGIGGAKYDQVTDDIARRFFGFSLPEYATASATLRLPIPHLTAGTDELRAVRHQLRDLTFHPERHLPAGGVLEAALAIAAEKQRWINTAKSLENAQARHVAITAANASLQPFVAPHRVQLEGERAGIELRLAQDAILESREYSFCLFPREHFERLLHR